MEKRFIAFSLFAAIFSVAFSQQSMTPNRYTPELLWKLGRVSDIQVSPDNKTLLYGVSWYNLEVNKGNRDLYTMPVSGGKASKVTTF